MIKKIIATANEQYHFNKAIDKFGTQAVIDERSKQLREQNPNLHPLAVSIQAQCETLLLGSIAQGETPFGNVHRALQQEGKKKVELQISPIST